MSETSPRYPGETILDQIDEAKSVRAARLADEQQAKLDAERQAIMDEVQRHYTQAWTHISQHPQDVRAFTEALMVLKTKADAFLARQDAIATEQAAVQDGQRQLGTYQLDLKGYDGYVPVDIWAEVHKTLSRRSA